MGTLFGQPSQQRGRLASTHRYKTTHAAAHTFRLWRLGYRHTHARMHFQTLFAFVAVFAGVVQAAAVPRAVLNADGLGGINKRGEQQTDGLGNIVKRGEQQTDGFGNPNKRGEQKTDGFGNSNKRGEEQADGFGNPNKRGEQQTDGFGNPNKRGEEQADGFGNPN
ncbi:hypothetical protein VHEMI05814 [[Torrubiella] hemipterigena]|uniref:Uncharacterized protein n=1 Tax=[Torrubiella] hemipterigena TaxID=1531966 RepID=A0A0A1SYW2_9HYPO|nr:hypothetical protein VHEMI05814 [[Torrubiella] hemipterigena]